MSKKEPILPPGMESDPEGAEREVRQAAKDEAARVLTDDQRQSLLYEAGLSAAKIIDEGVGKERDRIRIAELKILESLGALDVESDKELEALQAKVR